MLREFTDNIEFADPLLRFDVPTRLEHNPLLHAAADASLLPLRLLPAVLRSQVRVPGTRLSRALARRAARECDVLVTTYDDLTGFGLEDLAGKTLLTSAISPVRLSVLSDLGVDMVVDAVPQPFNVTVTAAVLEALMLASVHWAASPTTTSWTSSWLPGWSRGSCTRAAGGAAAGSPSSSTRSPRSTCPTWSRSRPSRRSSPPFVMDAVEKAAAYAPPFIYSHVTGIVSPTGDEAEGWLIRSAAPRRS